LSKYAYVFLVIEFIHNRNFQTYIKKLYQTKSCGEKRVILKIELCKKDEVKRWMQYNKKEYPLFVKVEEILYICLHISASLPKEFKNL
jgi:hypothetical protein